MNYDQFRDLQHRSGLSLWELGDLLGIHPHHLQADDPAGGLPDQPVRMLIELARHLNMHPTDLVTELEPLLAYERNASAVTGRGDDRDAQAVLAALATARSPPTRDDLAEVLDWTLHRTAAALERATVRPDLAGPLALRRIPPDGYTLGPRLDTLTTDQHANITDLDNRRSLLTDDELSALQAVFTLGRFTAYEAWRDQHPDLEQQPKKRGLVRSPNGPNHAELHPDVLFSLRLRTDENHRRYAAGAFSSSNPTDPLDADPSPQ